MVAFSFRSLCRRGGRTGSCRTGVAALWIAAMFMSLPNPVGAQQTAPAEEPDSPFRYIAPSKAFAEHAAARLYRTGQYAMAVSLLEHVVDAGWASRTSERSAGIKPAERMARLLKRPEGSFDALRLAVRVRAMRRWVHGDEPVIAFVPPVARVMGWTSSDLSEVRPIAIAAHGPGGAGVEELRAVAPDRIIGSRDAKLAARGAVPGATGPATVAVGEPVKVKAPAGRPAGIGAATGLRRPRGQAASAPAVGPQLGGRYDDWRDQVFVH